MSLGALDGPKGQFQRFEDVFILDVYTAIFVWVGEHANESEKAAAVETAAEYLKVMKLDPETPVVTVKSGKEPEMFQAFFLGWDESKRTSFTDPYQAAAPASC